MRALPAPLVVFTTNKTSINVDVGQADGTETFEVEVKDAAIDLESQSISQHLQAQDL
jgi:hypothetical protein